MPGIPIDLEPLIEDMHRVCGDTDFTKIECAEAYEEIASVAEISGRAIREEIEAEEAGGLDDDGA